jgi:uncharacterized paraquat-inducible protein A
MKKVLITSLMLALVLAISACVNRMAPFSPHRTNTDAHRGAQSNQACIECHKTAEIGHDHQATDDCLRCHRIVQGD